MTDTRRNERFRWYVKRFLAGEGPDDEREVRDAEDGSGFVVEDADGTTRIRVAELLRPPGGGDRESVRAFRRALAGEAERRWSERGGPAVEVWVEFSGHEQTTAARQRDELAAALCALVEEALPEPDGFGRLVPDDPGDGGNFPLLVSGVSIARLSEYTGSSWHVAAGAPAKGLDADRVEAAVREASSEERSPADRRWLLLVADSFRLTGGPAVPDEVEDAQYESGFDRIVLFDPTTGKATPLRTTPAKPEG